MSDVCDLESRRWKQQADPKNHRPETALREALRQIEAGEIKPEHIIVLHGHHLEDGTSQVGYLQAGSFNELAQVGMCTRGFRLMSQFDQ